MRNFESQLRTFKPDAIIVVGYGRIIPQWMLDLPPLGNLNLHASLLPKYRGAAPIQWAIARGETVTGVTTMRIDAGLDTGDILLQQELRIGPDDTSETLSPPLSDIGADLMVVTLQGLQAGTVKATPQDNSRVHACPNSDRKTMDASISSFSPGNLQPAARLPALAGSIHRLSRKGLADTRCQAG